ncbi:heat shock protein Hsp20 [Methanococcus vannielii SB]|uniref:Heat shock protein Hsp20 n=1 Tax=Methanococcus vannielii (strain ATCC 35089 / DSM 1224 / JCM 13029 / OCM 148 / SB) TaxID=406327 RepID=A6USD0_METVS|nr:Hsp20/alpha crystallin family protein [Methanococcus vannielii]ABR55402.1 heat shock protein Hsp20 [Methanococcus vannielii SB]
MIGRDPKDPFSEIFKMFGMSFPMEGFGGPMTRTMFQMGTAGLEISGKGYMPLTIIEGDESIKIIALIPGVNKSDIVINAVGDTLELRAKKAPLAIMESEKIIYSEVAEDEEIYKTIKLPAHVKEGKSSAKFENGILTIALPKTEKSLRTGIDIE